jgi:hypothetical protein
MAEEFFEYEFAFDQILDEQDAFLSTNRFESDDLILDLNNNLNEFQNENLIEHSKINKYQSSYFSDPSIRSNFFEDSTDETSLTLKSNNNNNNNNNKTILYDSSLFLNNNLKSVNQIRM